MKHLLILILLVLTGSLAHNLAAKPKFAGVVKDMQRELLRVMKQVGLTPENDKMPLDEGIKSELPDQKIR